jgi:pimeloyl-ACP methyl ester carboxylesterase
MIKNIVKKQETEPALLVDSAQSPPGPMAAILWEQCPFEIVVLEGAGHSPHLDRRSVERGCDIDIIRHH